MAHPLFWTRVLAALSGAALAWGGLEYLAQVPPPGSSAVFCADANRAALAEAARLGGRMELRGALGALGGIGRCPVVSPLAWGLLVLGAAGLMVSLLVGMVLGRLARLEEALMRQKDGAGALAARLAALETAMAGREAPPPAPTGDLTPRLARLEGALAEREGATTRAFARLARLEEAMAARAAAGVEQPSAAGAVAAAPPPPEAPPLLPEDHPLVLQVAEEMRAQGLNISPEVAQHVATLRMPRAEAERA